MDADYELVLFSSSALQAELSYSDEDFVFCVNAAPLSFGTVDPAVELKRALVGLLLDHKAASDIVSNAGSAPSNGTAFDIQWPENSRAVRVSVRVHLGVSATDSAVTNTRRHRQPLSCCRVRLQELWLGT